MNTTLYYNAYGDESGHRHKVTLMGNYDPADSDWHAYIAEQCAEDWHSNHDGFEARWPRVFVLYADKDGPHFARFEVDRETVPQFNASAA